DQRQLPGSIVWLDCRDVQSVREAIKQLSVRGAPAIGIAAAYGCVIGAQRGEFARATAHLATSRPTAVNLFWAIDRMASLSTDDPAALLAEARRIHDEDRAMCRAIGEHGLALMPDGGAVITHCNAGALATGGIGTATAPMYLAQEAGRRLRVFADETRPLLQGARLTAWELGQAGLDVTVLCDNTAGQVMREGRIDLVITGADRVAANGDAANKIGTYALAVLARHHGIPFYVAAPSSTFDRSLESGALIPIEQRHAEEVTRGFGRRTAPDQVNVYNPAFDVTPADLIAGIITERGLIRPVNAQNVKAMLTQAAAHTPQAAP
ncbi:MAG: S-methyl-5-thioribose-1-phosphate isomerase, partial [Alphaproteobacteria bacterium]|nr:S-methyl-5-thioribose-1-phosphate isomerase [Alphaproteobacteria bacterium]